MRGRAAAVVCALLLGHPAAAQSVLERSPNVQGTWSLDRGRAAFVFAHRFEFLNGGDELFSIPMLSLAAGLPFGVTLGLDYTSFSEAIPTRITANETQYWLKKSVSMGQRLGAAGMVAYNRGAGSVDGALNVRVPLGRAAIFGEGRVFSNLFGSKDGGAAGAIGGAVHLTRHLAITGDVGRVLTEDTVPTAWSAALAVEIPGTPHTLSLVATNTGAPTLQGASRRKSIGEQDVRYGFAFTVPLGTLGQWGRIFRPVAAPPPPPEAGIARRIEMRAIDYFPAEARVRVGDTVEWINLDPVAHTVTAEEGSWGSDWIGEGGRYTRRFDAAGRYPYICIPHPGMTGVLIVEP